MDKCKLIDWVYEGSTFYKYQIGDYEFTSMWGAYHNDKLYFVKIKSELIKYEEYDIKMKATFEAIYKIYLNKFGKPDEFTGIPAWNTTDKGYSYEVVNWTIGIKKVVFEVEDWGTYYSLNIIIYLPEISRQVNIENAEKEKESVQEGVELL